jgi:hypothetical protein
MEELMNIIKDNQNDTIEIFFEYISNPDKEFILEIKENPHYKSFIESIHKYKNKKDIYNNIIIKQDRYNNIIRDTINDENKIYTQKYIFLKSIMINQNINVIIFKVDRVFLKPETFPNLNKYTFTKQIKHSKYELEEIHILINNNIVNLEIFPNKNIDKIKKNLDDIITLFIY